MRICNNCVHIKVCGYRHTMDINDSYAEQCEDFKADNQNEEEEVVVA